MREGNRMTGLGSLYERMKLVRDEMKQVILGQELVLEQLLTCFLADGHVLVEGVPGLGKTLLSRTLARLVDAKYRRIQFTPDLLPSDIVGTNIFDAKSTEFRLRKGPIFSEIVLADEINRTPPKTQAAVLEAMEEKQVTIDGVKNPLPELFFVMATQNPVEYEGTYPLPETQLDRFMMKVTIDYPPQEAERAVIRSYAQGIDLRDLDSLIPAPVVTKKDVLKFRKDLHAVVVDEGVMEYIRHITAGTRDAGYVQLGASTRAAVATLKAARALAAIRGMDFVTPEEVKDVCVPVLRHRVILRPEALIDGLTPDHFLKQVLQRIRVPR
jgi:MoxR-like ATPase